MNKGQSLINSSIPSGASTPVTYDGGRSALVIQAGSYGGGAQLQLQGPTGGWINVGSAVTADSVVPFDATGGQYRISGSSIVGVNAWLTSIPYI